ncbi:hypothetical protein [Pseudooceanicola sp. 200-1SW]|uniref:hypothetical protein n=1 Tax=Pseudooceanicola sp. 200-1SW TaxID=3425949 RepID=UPI003D7FF9B2
MSALRRGARALLALTLGASALWLGPASPGRAADSAGGGLWSKVQGDPALLAQEMRALLLAEPELIPQIREEARRRMAADAASDLAAEIAGDRATIADLAPALFAASPRGFGADRAMAQITLFTAARCADCAQAEAELRALAAEMPGLRVEIRSLSDSDADLAWRALETAQGPQAAAAFRAALLEPPQAEPEALLRAQGIDPATLPVTETLRAELAAQAALFARLDLDTAPSYVMADRLIRGAMPGVVLRRYLSE